MNSHILLVEDEPGLVLTLGDRLRNEGYEVEALDNGEEALERAARNHFGLIILDVMLPGKSGLEVCQELRQRGFSTPILMLTARTQMADKVKGLKIGADDYLTKPFEMPELLARVEALLRRGKTGLAMRGRTSMTLDRSGSICGVPKCFATARPPDSRPRSFNCFDTSSNIAAGPSAATTS